MEQVGKIIHLLHQQFEPHIGQKQVIKDLFWHEVDRLFVECGRKFGKTQLVCYCLWRWCLVFPNSKCYYFSPFAKQSKEIIWAPRFIQNFGPTEFIKSINNTEMRIRFKNGSFIKLDGSDNLEAYRGITPDGLCVYDEFKDFKKEFHEAFEPNLAARGSPLLIVGTPPRLEDEDEDKPSQFRVLADEFKRKDYRNAA